MTYWKDCELPDSCLFPDRYAILEAIHESASSSVYLAQDNTGKQKVAIKCFKPSAKGAYIREIAASFDLQHANLAGCVDTFYRTDGVACIVYEYLSGGSLANLLEGGKKLASATIFACLKDVLRALVYLHDRNCIHCDIKPQNILLRPNTEGGYEYVLADFGSVCFLREANENRNTAGTPAYIAPERIQVRGRLYFNSDLYSLGVSAFEMAMGRPLYEGSIEEINQAHLTEIPSLAMIESPALRDFIDYLLVKDPLRRLQTAALTLEFLDKVLKTDIPIEYSRKQQWHNSVPINANVKTLHCFDIAGQHFIALVYPNYIDVANTTLLHSQPIYRLFTDYPVQILNNVELAYATPSRINRLNLQTGSEYLQKEFLNNLHAWRVGSCSLVFSDAFYYFFESLDSKNSSCFRLGEYLFKSCLELVESNRFLTCDGNANNNVVLRDQFGQSLQVWRFDDPVVGLCYYQGIVLVVCINLKNAKYHSLWSFELGKTEKFLVSADDIRQVVCINGAVFWLSGTSTLMKCATDSKPQKVLAVAGEITMFAVSYEHSLVALAVKDDEKRIILNIIKIEQCHEIP
ncbi:hypothetical protein JCM14076_08030 [Methylosoma difficile]